MTGRSAINLGYDRRGARRLRIILTLQIAWVVLLGVVARGIFPAGEALGWAEQAFGLSFLPALLAFPIPTILPGRRVSSPTWVRPAIILIEFALSFAATIAALPMFR